MPNLANAFLKTTPLLMSVSAAEECRARNDRQSYFAITRELVRAQFELADMELSRRLWQDVADRDLEVGRILHLLYGCGCHHDEAEMVDVDETYLSMGVD
ncbi:hypothetical protein [Synechococcus sp. RS9916]|uniref:hypothetical protein n=1 Tax=Synechococcus sp. RS9916 TaxID=221359 RepID=UPI0000E53D99|nr:hypothetical protein [Synechococcus sp. RS9916]EAU73197.1 hypothetical protein RS9916_26839 [Synechococcus sp. RS9916]